MKKIINLREEIKQNLKPVSEKKPAIADQPKTNILQKVPPPLPPTTQLKQASAKISPQISWEVSSFHLNPNKKHLIPIIIGALGIGGIGMLFYEKDALTAIFLLLSSLVLILHSGKKPNSFKVVINQTGVAIGDIMHYYKDLKSFWIHYQPGVVKELSLESRKWYVPYIRISIENKNPLAIRSLLINFLLEKEHENSLVDIIARRMGL